MSEGAAAATANPFTSAAIARQLLHHAWPVLIAQVVSVIMMIADTIIAGRAGTADLAGIAIGSGFYVSVVMLLTGTLQAVSPTVAHHYGAGRSVGPALQQGLWLAGTRLAGHPRLAFPDPAAVGERTAEVPPERAPSQATAFGLPAVLLYRTFYAFNNAVGRPRALMAISAIVTSAHLPLAWSLTNGAFGLPELGGTGCGVSTAIVSWLAVGCGLIYLVRNPAYRPYRIFTHWQAPRPRALSALLRLGVPMGLSTFIDITSFTLIAIFVAQLGAETVAGHRVVANLTGLIYMVPLALSISTLVLVGQAAGAHDWKRARATAQVGLSLAGSFALVIGAVLWLVRGPSSPIPRSIQPYGKALGWSFYCAFTRPLTVQTSLRTRAATR